MGTIARSYRELDVYKAAIELQHNIFKETKSWPADEKYSLTDQIRRSSRSIGANVAEAWAKRRYPAHFLSKLTDSDGELLETIHWLDTARACGYLPELDYLKASEMAGRLARRLGSMIASYESFCLTV